MERRVHILPDEATLFAACAERIAALAAHAIAVRRGFHWALAGGSTPQGLYRLLASPVWRGHIDWSQVHIWFGDERCVPAAHPDSNYRMARETLLAHVPIPPAHVHAIDCSRAPKEAAHAYSTLLARSLPSDDDGIPRLDLALLGMGADGHTASLFPETEVLTRTDFGAAALHLRDQDTWRVSLTYTTLNAARHIGVLVSGAGKAAAVAQALGPGDELPVQRLAPLAPLEWFLDVGAAQQLTAEHCMTPLHRTRQVLAGDIGGTKTLLRLAAFDGTAPGGTTLAEQRFDSSAYADLAPMVEDFLGRDDAANLTAACFGVAGPVEGNAVHQYARLTNLPWQLDSERLAQRLGLPRVRLINDFQAVGYGIEALDAADLTTLQRAPARPRAPRVVIGAGTGLGVGLLFWDTDHYEAYPTEGGHAHFAAVDEEQAALLAHLRRQFGRVSYERLLSGPGLEAIYRFLAERTPDHSPADDPILLHEDPAAAVSARAAAAPNSLAARALELFVAIYGAAAGDLALTCLAYGGVYVAGGIAPKIIERLRGGTFMRAFHDKGRMRALVEDMPVHVVLNAKVGLLGAALAGSRL